MTPHIKNNDAFFALTIAGFEVQEAMNGMHVVGYNARKNGVIYICAHDDSGWHTTERLEKVLNGTAPVSPWAWWN